MLDTTTKQKIDSLRNLLVGKVPDPKSQVEQITIALFYKFMWDRDKEIKDLRIAFRSFLSLVNKAKKALAKFEDEAKRGTVLARSSKKDFMNLLKRLQDTIAKLVASIKQILDTPEEQLQEVTKEEMLNRWKEVQEAYDKTIEANSALKELLKGEGEGASDDVVNLAYSTALNLSQYFPSVNPFSKGAQSKADLTRYKDTFQSAIDDVKESLQYVVNIATRGIVNASSLYESSEALQEFSEKIKDIFGVEGPISGDYNPKSEPAAEGESKSEETETVPVEWNPETELGREMIRKMMTPEAEESGITPEEIGKTIKRINDLLDEKGIKPEDYLADDDLLDAEIKRAMEANDLGEYLANRGVFKNIKDITRKLQNTISKAQEKFIEKIYNHYFEYLHQSISATAEGDTAEKLASYMISFIGNIIKAIDEEKPPTNENIAQVTNLMSKEYTKYVISAYKDRESIKDPEYQKNINLAIKKVGDLEFAEIIKQIIDDYISGEINNIIKKAKPEEEEVPEEQEQEEEAPEEEPVPEPEKEEEEKEEEEEIDIYKAREYFDNEEWEKSRKADEILNDPVKLIDHLESLKGEDKKYYRENFKEYVKLFLSELEKIEPKPFTLQEEIYRVFKKIRATQEFKKFADKILIGHRKNYEMKKVLNALSQEDLELYFGLLGPLQKLYRAAQGLIDEGKIEEQIVNKLKPLIKEMLRRN